MGFATLPNQVHRKSVKKGFDFTLMVAGRMGQGWAGQGLFQVELMCVSEERKGRRSEPQMTVPLFL